MTEISMDFDYETMLRPGWDALDELFSRYESEEYAAEYLCRQQLLRGAFKNYRSLDPKAQSYLKRLMESHTAQCRINGGTEGKRRHNTFVLTYITDRIFSPKEIARLQGITLRAMYKDLNHVLDDLMVLAFGVDGIKPKSGANTKLNEKNTTESVR